MKYLELNPLIKMMLTPHIINQQTGITEIVDRCSGCGNYFVAIIKSNVVTLEDEVLFRSDCVFKNKEQARESLKKLKENLKIITSN